MKSFNKSNNIDGDNNGNDINDLNDNNNHSINDDNDDDNDNNNNNDNNDDSINKAASCRRMRLSLDKALRFFSLNRLSPTE